MCATIRKRLKTIRVDDIMKRANILSLSETHLSGHDHLSVDMLMLPDDMLMIRSDCNNFGSGVALLIGNHLHPKKLKKFIQYVKWLQLQLITLLNC